MDFICKDLYGRDILRESYGTGYRYHVRDGGTDVCVFDRPIGVPVRDAIETANGMRPVKLPAALAREELKAQVNAIRADRLDAPISFKGVMYDGDAFAQANVIGTLLPFLGGVPMPEGFTWRSLDNTDVPFTLADLVAFSAAFLQRGYACHMNGRALKAAIDAADDPYTVDIREGWPE